MKSILISIQPKWCELIASGKKTIEVRKTRPKIETPFKCYIYCTSGMLLYENYPNGNKSREIKIANYRYKRQSHSLNCKVIGEYVCDRIINLKLNWDDCGNYWHEWDDECDVEDMCLSYKELEAYLCKNTGYGWHISDLRIYDKPKELKKFRTPCSKSIHCRACGYSEIVWHDDEKCFYYECRRPSITRAPQSWCYVEETE